MPKAAKTNSLGKLSCAFPGCKSREGQGISFFLFPRDLERSIVWVEVCNRDDLRLMTVDELHKKFKMCELHFEEKFKSKGATKTILFSNAVPASSSRAKISISFVTEGVSERQAFSLIPNRILEIIEQDTKTQERTSNLQELELLPLPSTSDQPPLLSPTASTQTPKALSSETPRKQKLTSFSIITKKNLSLESQFKSNVLLEKIEPIAVIKSEPEIDINQDIISADIKDEIDIEYHIISEDLIKSEPNPNNLLKSEHLKSVETQRLIQTENTPFIKTEFENLVKTEDTSDGNLFSESTNKKRKAKIDNCNKCKYKTLWRKNLEKHKVIHLKPNKIQFLCYHCPYKSNYKQHLKRHVFSHFKNGEVPFHCYICDFVTPKRNLIIEHFKKHPEHRSKWDETEYKNHIGAYTKKHKVIHLKPNKIQYLCNHCSYKSNYRRNLRRHVFSHFKNEEVPFHCYLCDFITSKRNLIIEHFKKHPEHHSKWDETEYKNQIEAYTKKRIRYYCKKCRFYSNQDVNLKLHELSHEAERDEQYLKYCCDQCKYKTFRLTNFNRHKKLHLKPEEIPYFYCYHCTYKSNKKFDLYKHILTHFKNGEVPFYCYICDFVTPKRDLIIEHFKKHPEHRSKCDEKDHKINLKRHYYYCKKCMFRTYQYEKLKLHELTHKETDDRYLKYQCDKCTYKTFNKGSFKNHKLIHLKPEEIQWFYCYHCSYKAKKKGLLRNHIRRHFKNEVVKFNCYMCNFITLKRESISEHIKKHFKVQIKSKINKRT